MTEPGPTPVFRRFPWIQLAFCLACLSMAAWTWTRYSYAWPVGLRELDADPASPEGLWLRERYVTFSGQPCFPNFPGLDIPGRPRANRFRVWMPVDPTAKTNDGEYIACTGPMPRVGKRTLMPLWGRVRIETIIFPLGGAGGQEFAMVSVDCGGGRLTGASIAGLVVGAMGCFVFGLYLRGWLVERRALADQPRRDVIA